jgi:hypothetical protein
MTPSAACVDFLLSERRAAPEAIYTFGGASQVAPAAGMRASFDPFALTHNEKWLFSGEEDIRLN